MNKSDCPRNSDLSLSGDEHSDIHFFHSQAKITSKFSSQYQHDSRLIDHPFIHITKVSRKKLKPIVGYWKSRGHLFMSLKYVVIHRKKI
ncbi:unnamed protein product [Tenebrio molitor]|nr:unnamed protein product [Tenebrio molitor]